MKPYSTTLTILFTAILAYFLHPSAKPNQHGEALFVHYQLGTTYYVDGDHPDADNKNDGTSEDYPWKTIQHAADIATAGDIVIVKAGTYNERVVPVNSGAPEAKITFKAQPRRSVTMWGFYTVNSDYLRIEGFNITTDPSLTDWTESNGVFIRSDYVEVVDNYFYNIDAGAIAGYFHEPFPQAAHIANNTIYHCQAGIGIRGNDWIVEGNEVNRLFQYGPGDCDYTRFFGDNHIFRNNYFHGTDFNEIGDAHVDCFQTFTNNGEHAYNILFEGNICYDFHQGLMASNVNNTATSHFTLRNNLFVAHGGSWGLCIHDISYVTAENNTFADIRYHGAGFNGNSIGNVVQNNIFYNIDSSYWGKDGAQVTGDYNLIFNTKSPPLLGEHDILDKDPSFVNPANNDFHLQFDSPAIDKGENLPQVNFDLDQNKRPQGNGWDIGAYEFAPDLDLHGTPGNKTIYLDWTVNITIPETTTWYIEYYTQTTTSPYTATDSSNLTRSAVLTDNVVNGQTYTVTLSAMLDETPLLSDTVQVTPTRFRFVYLPLVLR